MLGLSSSNWEVFELIFGRSLLRGIEAAPAYVLVAMSRTAQCTAEIEQPRKAGF
jgi:hypothetical protein